MNCKTDQYLRAYCKLLKSKHLAVKTILMNQKFGCMQGPPAPPPPPPKKKKKKNNNKKKQTKTTTTTNKQNKTNKKQQHYVHPSIRSKP